MPRIAELNNRSQEIFRHIVDAYVESGEPIGSRTLSRRLSVPLSPATIRNVMADLEDAGLLYAPHASAGRLPTDAGLRLYIDGILEVGRLSEAERAEIDTRCRSTGRSVEEMLSEAISALSGLSSCAGLVLAPKMEAALKHIEFVPLGPGRALVVMVLDSGMVENRVIELPPGLPPASLIEAGNFLSTRMAGRTVGEAREQIQQELERARGDLDEITQRLVAEGLAVWSGGKGDGALIVRGQSKLLEDVTAVADLERIRALFTALEAKEHMIRILDLVHQGAGVQIFIGAENALFSMAGCSMVVAPYRNTREEIVGAIGVIGPTRINYARIIPLVDYTSKVIGRLMG